MLGLGCHRWPGVAAVFCTLGSPLGKTSLSSEDSCNPSAAFTAQQALVGGWRRSPLEHRPGALGANQLCSLLLVAHPPTLQGALLSQLLSELLPTGSMDRNTPGLGLFLFPDLHYLRHNQTHPSRPTHGAAAGAAVSVLS